MNRSEEQISAQTKNFIQEIERRSDFPGTYILGVLGVSLLLVYFNILELHLTNIISIVYGVYWTMKSFENREEGDDKQWLTYWMIWGFFFFLDIIMPNFLKKIPMFYFAKLLFLSWLFLPSTKGALFLYERIFSKINLPFKLDRIYEITDNFKIKINKLIDYALMTDQSDLQTREHKKKDFTPEEREHTEREREKPKKSPEEIVREVIGTGGRRETETSVGSNNQNYHDFTKEPIHERYPKFNEEETEARQNIVHDAKIDTDRMRANLQNVKDQFAHSIDRLKEVRENIGSDNKANVQSPRNKTRENQVQPQIQPEAQPQNIPQQPLEKITPNAPTLNVPNDKEIYQTTFSKTNDKQHPREVLPEKKIL
jgi:hypothetical protein